ncbi:MAG: hypothetical protein A2287_08480 [Candidatus Melainabacteria bacterium RIFOXYA12_FULL_32_12]|nr:MAG: hypothetical protein A2287_08480 [Candidatus Melainabacteria bacterium RIFOXYA12_FULL_32_12]
MQKNILKIKSGFTLAEILVTLTIIGIIAALTIPSLIQNVQDEQYKAAWKKDFAVISQATMQILYNNGGTISNVFASYNNAKNEYKEYLNFITECNGGAVLGACWHPDTITLKGLDGSDFGGIDSDSSGLILSNGSYCIFTIRPACVGGFCGSILVDVNGSKNPNLIGKDIFRIDVTTTSIMPEGAPNSMLEGVAGHTCSLDDSGYNCANEYLYR